LASSSPAYGGRRGDQGHGKRRPGNRIELRRNWPKPCQAALPALLTSEQLHDREVVSRDRIHPKLDELVQSLEIVDRPRERQQLPVLQPRGPLLVQERMPDGHAVDQPGELVVGLQALKAPLIADPKEPKRLRRPLGEHADDVGVARDHHDRPTAAVPVEELEKQCDERLGRLLEVELDGIGTRRRDPHLLESGTAEHGAPEPW